MKYSYINRDAKMNCRKWDICNSDFHRASYAKHVRKKKRRKTKRNDYTRMVI